MGWIVYSVFVSFAAPIIIGFWLGNRAHLDFGGIIKGALLGLILLIAIFYVTELLGDLYLWKTYVAEKSTTEALGKDWLVNPFWRALRTLVISYVFFLMTYLIRVFVRGRASKIAHTLGGV